ncbi:MAG: ABC transporter permease [Paludibacteraceae bacterium]|nr:ABC transporter permease [Paludibacteraceae bacterium]
MDFWKSYRLVFARELREMLSRPLYVFGSVGVMLACCVFFLTLMNEGLPERLPVGIVDMDQSTISRMVRRELDAGQQVQVIKEYANYTEAREALQNAEIYAFLYLPANMYSDLLAFKRPTITLYANSAYTLGGTLAYKQLLTMANLASGAIQRQVMRGRGMKDDQIMPVIQPIVVDTHILGNPWVNYSVYLCTTLLPGTLGMMILMLTSFSLLHEFKKGTEKEWLRTGNNNIIIAAIGKLSPYWILFIIMAWAINILMFKALHFPMAGSFWYLCVAEGLYLMAMQGVSLFIVSCVPASGLGISLSGLYSTLAFTMAGFSYPVETMLSVFQALSTLFPLRHYYLITIDQMLMGLPISHSLLETAYLMCFVVVALVMSLRLKSIIVSEE